MFSNFSELPKTMSLDGGIDMYSFQGNRYQSEESPEGRKVIFLNRNGYEMQLKDAAKYFEEGQVLTVKEIYVGKSSSTVEFIEYPNMEFNTVMFADAE